MACSEGLATVKSCPQTRARTLSKAVPLLTARNKCRAIWKSIAEADYKKEGVLNYPALKLLFEKQRPNFAQLLEVRSLQELLDLLGNRG